MAALATHFLAIHAAGATPEMWDDVRAELGDAPLLTPDINRLARESDGRLDALVGRLCAELPDGELVLAGCSLGANIALEVAAELGPRARGLLMVTPQPVETDDHVREGLRGLQESTLHWTPEQLLTIVPLLLYPGNPRYERSARILGRMLLEATGAPAAPLMRIGMELPPAGPALQRLACECRVIFGAHTVNPICGPDWIPAWRRALGESRVMLAEHASELVVMERPELIAEVLRGFSLACQPG